MAQRAVRVVIAGRVQGVGFRAFVAGEAARHGIAGWVRNRRDGTVEAVFIGEGAAVDAMLAACRRGPRVSPRSSDVAVSDYVGPALTPLHRTADGIVFPNSVSNSRRSAMSTSSMVAMMPRSARLVTP